MWSYQPIWIPANFCSGQKVHCSSKNFCCVSLFITIVQHVFLIHLFRMWKESVNWYKVECSTCSVRAIHFSRAHNSKTGQDRPRKLWVVLLELKYYPDIKLQVPAVRYTRMPSPLGVRGPVVLEGRPVFLTWWVAKVIYTVFKEYDCYKMVYDPISQRDIGDCAIIKTFYSRPIHSVPKWWI